MIKKLNEGIYNIREEGQEPFAIVINEEDYREFQREMKYATIPEGLKIQSICGLKTIKIPHHLYSVDFLPKNQSLILTKEAYQTIKELFE